MKLLWSAALIWLSQACGSAAATDRLRGNAVPLDEPVISPAAMFAWPGLESVVAK